MYTPYKKDYVIFTIDHNHNKRDSSLPEPLPPTNAEADTRKYVI
jgi:hypothetical protein